MMGRGSNLQYIADAIRRVPVIDLGKTKAKQYPKGASSFSFTVGRVDVSNIKARDLENAGLFVVNLFSQDSEPRRLFNLNIVVKTYHPEGSADGVFMRRIFNPFESMHTPQSISHELNSEI